ncbi:MAG: hypothetical protein JSR24_09490 [Proteobacteria bacterium]|nr:hypothetical protein [Pseudomonadota bacterium]
MPGFARSIAAAASGGVMLAAFCLGLPATARAQLASCQVGQRVAYKNHYDKWTPGVVIAVNPGSPYPCRVHRLGANDLEQESWPASGLRPPEAATEPVGPDTTDPWLRGAGGRAAPQQPHAVPGGRAAAVLRGNYECYNFGRPRIMLNLSILDARTYRDSSGTTAHYSFDPATGMIVFQGGILDGQRATFAQPTNPPSARNPPTITYQVSGDSCDLKL